jgi:tetratricopeptide (TPR) repeat protein
VKKGRALNELPEMARARKGLKPVILYFYSGKDDGLRGRACERLNQKVLLDTTIVKHAREYLCLAADFEKLHTTLRIGFGVKTAPTLLLADAFGKVHYTLTPRSLTRKTLQRVMKSTLTRHKAAVRAFQRKREAWERKLGEADQLLYRNEFEKAEKLLSKLVKDPPTPDHEPKARAYIEEMAFGILFVRGVEALDEGRFEEAEEKLKTVAEAKTKNRWAYHALGIARSIPAARLYREALIDLDEGRTDVCVKKLEKVAVMDGAGKYAGMASATLRVLKSKAQASNR